jgi:hypothetical protein
MKKKHTHICDRELKAEREEDDEGTSTQKKEISSAGKTDTRRHSLHKSLYNQQKEE